MNGFLQRSLTVLSSALLLVSAARAEIPVPDEPGVVGYNPVVKIAQGNQPYTEPYTLLITMPATLTPGVNIPVNLDVVPISFPEGVSAATAQSFVTLSTSSVTVSQPSEVKTVTVNIAVPLGSQAGGYSWKVSTSGWPLSAGEITDSGHTINGLFSAPEETDDSTPAITLISPTNGTVYTYYPVTGVPANVPVNFTASVSATGQPIRGLSAYINGDPVSHVATGLNTQSASGAGAVGLTAPGFYTITASATNLNGSSTATAEISVVVSAPAPTITASSPTPAANFNFTLGSSGVSVPVSFTATSLYGNISAISATLNGNPVVLTQSGVGSDLVATGSTSLTITTPGSYTLAFNASNEYGAATPVSVPFTVTGVAPAPTVAIQTPANGTIFTRTQGAPATVVNYAFTGGTSFGNVTSVAVTVDGQPVSASVLGLNTSSITGSGSLSYSSGGAHTLTVVVSNGSATASASTTFTVQQNPAQLCRDLEWLPPISLNKTVEGGSVVPIKFTLTCRGVFVRDTAVVIAISEVYANGSTSAPTLYPYGSGSPNPPDYAITGQQYHLNFTTASGKHRYRVEVYTTANGTPKFIDSIDIFTKKKGREDDDCRDWKREHRCRNHNHDHDRDCRNRDHDHDGRDRHRDRNDDCDEDHDCRNRDHDHDGRDRNRGRDKSCDRDRGR